MALDTCGRALGCHGMWLPNVINIENGTANFSDALSQTQYRTCARFFRSAKATSAATAANKVDCQMCVKIVVKASANSVDCQR